MGITAVIAAAITTAGIGSLTGTANAATGTPVTEVGGHTGMCGSVVCLYFNSPQHGWGAIWETNNLTVPNLAGQFFSFNPAAPGGNGGNGAGQPVKNNAGGVENDTTNATDFIYFNSSAFGWGNYDYVLPQQSGKLVTTYNNDAAFSIFLQD
jgi:hypothetical protein